jgi:hypothetical protein
MVSFTKLLRDAQRRLAMPAQEAEKVIASYKICLRGLNYVGC